MCDTIGGGGGLHLVIGERDDVGEIFKVSKLPLPLPSMPSKITYSPQVDPPYLAVAKQLRCAKSRFLLLVGLLIMRSEVTEVRGLLALSIYQINNGVVKRAKMDMLIMRVGNVYSTCLFYSPYQFQ
jgi:hypothetical protein